MNFKSLLFIVILSVTFMVTLSTTELTSHQIENLFSIFLQKFGKEYTTPDEHDRRYETFKKNIKIAEKLNLKHEFTKYGMTKFMDMSQEEFQNLHLSPVYSMLNSQKKDIGKPKKHIESPEAFDWRDHGAVTSVKNQGQCGSCWAFSATSQIEGVWAIAGHDLVSLSEQQIVDCDKQSYGCSGGFMDNAFQYVIDAGGLETDEEYKYHAKQGKCSADPTKFVAKISGYKDLSTDEDEIRDYLYQNGPVSVALNANNLQFYHEGIIHGDCSTSLNHGVLLVGFGEENDVPFWQVKNSWGPQFGELGYFRIERGTGKCGINLKASASYV